jgi:CRP-like cAMP-binding protein
MIMGTVRGSNRLLPDGTPLRNRLLATLPADVYAAASRDIRMVTFRVGEAIFENGAPVSHVYFPNGGVYSMTSEMQDGTLVEVSTVGFEGMLGANVFLGDAAATGRTFMQVPNGPLPKMSASRFTKLTTDEGPFRTAVSHYVQATLIQGMQGTACNALHDLKQRACRWLLQTHDRVGADEFLMKHEFMAIMLGTTRPQVSKVLGGLQKSGAISTRYGRIVVTDRKKLERGSCECYAVISDHFARLGL